MTTTEVMLRNQGVDLARASLQLSYGKARESDDNPKVRQEFLNGLDLEDATKYVRKVIYDPREESFIEDDGYTVHPDTVYMLTIPPVHSPSLIKRLGLWRPRARIKVYRGAFDKCEHLGELLSALIDHEGYHAMEHCTGRSHDDYETNKRLREENPSNIFAYLSPEELRIQSEIGARENQLKMIESGRRDCSSDFIDTIRKELDWLYKASVT